MKTKLIELQLIRQSYMKKLANIEKQINQIKGENTYEQGRTIKGIFSTSKGM
jgi:hypothetical protein